MRFELALSLRVPVVLTVLAQLIACSAAESSNFAGNAAGSPPQPGTGSGGAPLGGGSAGSGGTSGAAGGGGGAPAAGGGDLPCAVQALLATKCQSCHKQQPPGALLSAADFARPSQSGPGKSVGQVALERVQATGNLRMPPSPLEPVTPAELSALSAWVGAGAPPTSCGDTPVPSAPDPYDTPVVCSSMKNWTNGNRESPLMRPGGACISCHRKEGEGPLFAVAGTLFPTPHEPDDCNGVTSATGAQVVITEASGASHTLSVNDAGNFFFEAGSFAYPYQAKVVYQGRERVMVEAQADGDCNSCHTEAGKENAPGRIFLP